MVSSPKFCICCWLAPYGKPDEIDDDERSVDVIVPVETLENGIDVTDMIHELGVQTVITPKKEPLESWFYVYSLFCASNLARHR